jgi:hypothetical protein
MTDWMTHPLGLTGFALFMVFRYLDEVNRDDERRWLSPAAVGLAAVALAGGPHPRLRTGSEPSDFAGRR